MSVSVSVATRRSFEFERLLTFYLTLTALLGEGAADNLVYALRFLVFFFFPASIGVAVATAPTAAGGESLLCVDALGDFSIPFLSMPMPRPPSVVTANFIFYIGEVGTPIMLGDFHANGEGELRGELHRRSPNILFMYMFSNTVPCSSGLVLAVAVALALVGLGLALALHC